MQSTYEIHMVYEEQDFPSNQAKASLIQRGIISHSGCLQELCLGWGEAWGQLPSWKATAHFFVQKS
jgi:hypothetical protein